MSWTEVPLHVVADLESGFGFPRERQGDPNQEFPFFRVSDMNLEGNETLMRNHTNTVSRQTLELLHARAFPAGTVIFPKIGAAIATEKKRILVRPATYDNNVMGAVPNAAVHPKFLYYWFTKINLSDYASASHVPSIRKSVMEEIPFALPPPSEQRRIVEILDQADALCKLRREANAKASRILPVLFLKMFGDPASNPMGWPVKRFPAVFEDHTAGQAKLQTKAFLPSGALPIVDQGQERVAGYTDDASVAYKGPLPVVLFGDHTRIFKFVDFSFVLGADGVRVLVAKDGFDPMFAYWHCRMLDIPNAGYSRHFKYLKEKNFIKPDATLQQKFARIAAAVGQNVDSAATAASTVDDLFSTLLQRAFSGQLTAKWRNTHMQELLVEMQEQVHLLSLPLPN